MSRKINLQLSINEQFKNTEEQVEWRRYRDETGTERVKETMLLRHGKESEDEKIKNSQEIRK